MMPTLNQQRWLKQRKVLLFLSGMMTGQNGALQLAWGFSKIKGQLDMQGDVSPGRGSTIPFHFCWMLLTMLIILL